MQENMQVKVYRLQSDAHETFEMGILKWESILVASRKTLLLRYTS